LDPGGSLGESFKKLRELDMPVLSIPLPVVGLAAMVVMAVGMGLVLW